MSTIQTGTTGDVRKTNFRAGLGLIVWMLLVPIALFGLGLWEWQRAGASLEDATQSIAGLTDTLRQVKDIAKTDPTAMLSFDGDDEPVHLSALVAEGQIQDSLGQANENLEISRIRQPLSWVTIGTAILAFIGGAVGLATASISSVRARQSRDKLIKSFHRLRSILPFILASVVIGFSGAVISATLFEGISLGFSSDLSSGSVKLIGGIVVLVAIAAYSAFMALKGLRDVFGLFTPTPHEVSGRAVGQSEAPELWRFVRKLAARQQALLPDTIIVGLTEGFWVTESQVRLWPEDRMLTGRTLYLPAPYLELLDEAEIAAVIGHEFAHFSGEDTLYSQKFAPIYAGFWRALRALQRVDGGRFVLYPAAKLGFHTIEQFDHAVGHWSRLREFEADRSGAMLGTPGDAAVALVRTGIIAPAVAFVLERAHGAPDGYGAGDLVAQTAELVRDKGWSEPALEDRQPHPTDSHPPTIRRIAALGVNVDEALLSRAKRPPETSPAQTLFADWAGFSNLLSRDFTDAARKAQTNRRAVLEKAAAEVVGETVIYNNVRPMQWTMAFLAVILLGFMVAMFEFSNELGLGHDDLARQIIAGVGGLGGIACVIYAVTLQSAAGKPLMILRPDELVSPPLDRPIAWTDIADLGVFISRRFALKLWLTRKAQLPKKNWRAIYSKVDDHQRIVTLGGLGVKGMKPAAFNELVRRYHYAAYARQELAAASAKAAAGETTNGR